MISLTTSGSSWKGCTPKGALPVLTSLEALRSSQMNFETMSSAIARMMTLCRLLKQPEQMALMLFLQAIQPKRLQEKVCSQLMTLACDAEDWTLQQVGEIAARLEKAHSFESLWMTAVRPERPAPTSAAPAPSQPPPHNPMRHITPLTCHECGKPGHKRPECPRWSWTKAPAAAHRGAAGPPSGPQDTRECYTCGEIGHISMQCPQRQMANAAANGPHTDGPSKPTGRKWCVNHQVSSHDTAECKRPPGQAVNQTPVAARSARPESEPALDQTVAAIDPNPGAPTQEQLMNLWDHIWIAHCAQYACLLRHCCDGPNGSVTRLCHSRESPGS
jgi:hypothetical protein